jgi:hypothetical protein
MTILPGTIGVLTTPQPGTPWLDRFFMRAIQFDTKSPAYHAFIYKGDGQIIEAIRHVSVSPVTNYTNITWLDHLVPVHDVVLGPGQRRLAADVRRHIVSSAESFVGESYNVLDILAIAWAQPRFHDALRGDDWIVRRLSDDHMQICSQLCVNAYRLAGADLFPGTPSGLVSPGNLLTLNEARGVVAGG